MALTARSVGKPWPHPLPGEGMQATLNPAPDEGPLAVMLVAAIDRPTAAELAAMRRRPLRLALLPSPPLVWFLLVTEGLSLDAPYGIGLHADAHRAALLASARQAQSWTGDTRGLLTAVLVDQSDGNVRVVRAVSCSRAWFEVLADALGAADRPLTRQDYAAAIDRDMARWPSTADMLAAATIAEIGGR